MFLRTVSSVPHEAHFQNESTEALIVMIIKNYPDFTKMKDLNVRKYVR